MKKTNNARSRVERWIDKLMEILLERLFVTLTIVWAISVAAVRRYWLECPNWDTFIRELYMVAIFTSVMEVLVFLKIIINYLDGNNLSEVRDKRLEESVIIIGITFIATGISYWINGREAITNMMFWASMSASILVCFFWIVQKKMYNW